VFPERVHQMLCLGIETSCDETSAAVVEDGRKIRSNIIASQTEIHGKYGGVVPEIASRHHVEQISQVVDLALEESGAKLNQIDLIGVTYGPGLVGALLVGLSFAKAMAFACGIPLVGVNHIQGHPCRLSRGRGPLSFSQPGGFRRSYRTDPCQGIRRLYPLGKNKG